MTKFELINLLKKDDTPYDDKWGIISTAVDDGVVTFDEGLDLVLEYLYIVEKM